MYAEENMRATSPHPEGRGTVLLAPCPGRQHERRGISENDEIWCGSSRRWKTVSLPCGVNGDEATVKYFRQEGSLVVLTPQKLQPRAPAQIYDLKRVQVRVVGLVVECRKVF